MGKKQRKSYKKPGEQKQPGPRDKRYLILAAVLLIFLGLAGYLAWRHESEPEMATPPLSSNPQGEAPAGPDNYKGLAPVTLSPSLFTGKTARAYQVAQEIPQVLSQIFCYCGCDMNAGHRNNLDCFRDNHGAT